MKVYKITDGNMKFFNYSQWELNVPRETLESLSKDFSYFLDIKIAAILHPLFNYENPRLFEAEAEGDIKNGYNIIGTCTRLTLKKEVEIPKISDIQRVVFGILFAQEKCEDKNWNTWAINWLNGCDRTFKSAYLNQTDFCSTSSRFASLAAMDFAINYSKIGFDVAMTIISGINRLEDTFTLDNILNTINKALEY